MGLLLQRLRGTFSLNGLHWSASNFAFVRDALASGSDLRHLHLGFVGAPASDSDEWYEPLFRALRCCRRLHTVQLEHGDDNDMCYFTRLHLGNEFRKWIGASTVLRKLKMYRFSFNRDFLSNAASGLMRSSSLVSLDFQKTRFEDLSVLGHALVEGATLQEFRIDKEAISDEFLLQLSHATHLETLIVDGKLDDHIVLLAKVVRVNTVLERISTSHTIDSEESPNTDDNEEIEQARATLDHYLALNRYGRRFLNTRVLSPGLWALVLVKASTHSEHAVLFDFFRCMPSLVRSRRGVSRSRRRTSCQDSNA